MKPDNTENIRVEQNNWGYCDGPAMLYTAGLGLCIGVCIAWGSCAAIVHSADIELDENEEISQMIARMKRAIPDHELVSVRPVVCGGDTCDDSGIDDDPTEHARVISSCRERIVAILKDSGFGDPHLRWNACYETTDLVADLKEGLVSILDHDSRRMLARWRISGELNNQR